MAIGTKLSDMLRRELVDRLKNASRKNIFTTHTAEAVFAKVREHYDTPPPFSDDVPLHHAAMSVGVMMGRLQAEGKFSSQQLMEACTVVCHQQSSDDIIRLIWNLVERKGIE